MSYIAKGAQGVLWLIAFGGGLRASTLFNIDFSLGNTGFTSGYTYQSDLVPEATYYVDTQPDSHNVNWTGPNFGDHTTGSGNMMVVNGAGSPIDVFSTTASLATNTTYFFSAWVASVYPLSPAQLQFSQDGTLLGSTFTASSAVGLWQLFEASFTTGSSVPALSTFAIVNQNTALSGNDFALDDIILGTSDQAVPEPATYGMMLAGLGAVFCLRKRG